MAELTDEQIKTEWDKADKDKSGTLSLKEIVSLLDKFNLRLKEKQVKKIFKQVDEDGSGELDFQEFRVFLSLLRIRPEVAQLFNMLYEQFHIDDEGEEDFSENHERTWTPSEFLTFLKTCQKETTIDLAAATELIKEIEHTKKSKKEGKGVLLTVSGLSAYMSSEKFSGVFNPQHSIVYQDMSQPYTHYFIASSHNTYLTGHQLTGESSVDAYVNAFKRGCKCVELDCWDGEDKTPIIYHGHTLTTKITFESAIQTVRDYGFMISDYPVILSLEVHCSIEGQQKMAQIMKDVLGAAGMLPEQPEVTGFLPPPNKLMKKVLLKGKMMSAKKSEEEDDDEDEEEEEEEATEPVNLTESDSKTKGRSESSAKSETKTPKSKKEKKKKESTAKELSDLIHLKTTHLKNFKENKEKKPDAWAMSSFAEGKVEKFIAKSAVDLIDYNTRQLSRIYPKGLRVDSSNYDPVPSWTCGCQIVALNYQTGSDPLWLNDGKFLGNGNSGYILKPQYMREKETTWDPEKQTTIQKTLTVKVISGWQFPKTHGTGKETKEKGDVIDPYVKLVVSGIPADKETKNTKTIKNNGFNPIWNETFRFTLRAPELALLMVNVVDEDIVSKDDFIGQYSLAITDIREGYRLVPLKDKQGNKYEKASILVHFSFDDGEVKQNHDDTKQESFLLKKTSSNWNNKWVQRWFTLQQSQVKYYQTKTDLKRPRSVFHISGLRCYPVKSLDTNFSHSFAIQTAQRTWFLRAGSAKELRDWRRNILSQGGKWEYSYSEDYVISKEGTVVKQKK